MAIFTLLFTAIYKVLPDPAISWRELVLGAFVTAALFTIGKSLITIGMLLIGMYPARTAPGSPYGGGRRADRPHVPDGLSAQIFLFGAELTKAFDDERASGPHRAR
jgi:membrane protein